MKKRVISATILVIIAAGAYIFGSFGAWLLTGIGSLLALIELYRVLGMSTKAPGYIGYLACAIYYAFLFPGFYDLWQVDIRHVFNPLLYLLFILIAMNFSMIIVYPRYGIKDVMCAFFGVVYCIFMFSYIFQTRYYFTHGLLYLILLFVSSWGADTGAYFFGRAFGKHKLHIKLSPNKTVEGAVGGVLVATIAMAIVVFVYGQIVPINLKHKLLVIFITLVASVCSIFGDLAASAIKRDFNIKDYSNFIPGHGGVLDRFDSVIFAAPVVYYMCKYLIERIAI